MRIVRLVIASRLCRDTGVIVIKQISAFVIDRGTLSDENIIEMLWV
jgi:hypothetical protein